MWKIVKFKIIFNYLKLHKHLQKFYIRGDYEGREGVESGDQAPTGADSPGKKS